MIPVQREHLGRWAPKVQTVLPGRRAMLVLLGQLVRLGQLVLLVLLVLLGVMGQLVLLEQPVLPDQLALVRAWLQPI